MINEPAIDELIKMMGETYDGSKYALCVIASKRARQLINIAKNQNNAQAFDNQKPLTQAAFEIIEGKITVSNN